MNYNFLKYKKPLLKQGCLIAAVLSLILLKPAHVNACDNDCYQIISLNGNWKFSIGDNMDWAKADFNDKNWETILAPASWESQGFQGYDGFAWYRKSFSIDKQYAHAGLHIMLGYIDDVDEVFINGVKIGGKGTFPPNFWTAYNAERKYYIPENVLRFDKPNVIAVRVYDAQLDGGIVSGKIGIHAEKNTVPYALNLQGYWKFKIGDNLAWKAPDFNDSDWQSIMVPGLWEDQISHSYDGFAWYRKEFILPKDMLGKRYVLMMGKIDDIDEVYLNGKKVGGIGTVYDEYHNHQTNIEYTYDRYYYLQIEDLKPGKNTIAVRVVDTGGGGGIYKGPIGLSEMKTFVNYWRNHKH